MNDKNKKLAQTRRQHVRRVRFMAGLRNLAIHHRAKLLVLLAYLLAVVLVWHNRGILLFPFPGSGIFDTIIRRCFSLAILIVGVALLPEIIIALGIPWGTARIHDNLRQAGFVNAVELPPLLLSIYKGEYEHIRIYEFDLNNVPLSQWEKEKNKIGAALKRIITSVTPSKNGNRVILHTVPMRTAFPDKVYWNDEYLSTSTDGFVLALGEGLTGRETVDLASTPHLMLGASSGGGKSQLMKVLVMQGLKLGAIVVLADFKGGVDFSPVWHQKCRMIFELQELLDILKELIKELEHRRGLFVAAGTSNIDEYNKATGADLQRYILACDEVAEILDKTGLRREEKEKYAQIVRHLALIARQGRVFGIHLILATQRPSADLIPGEIRTNLTFRICGRADDILSRIILDSPAAAEQIPVDAQGRFITNMGQVFQGYLFDDSILES